MINRCARGTESTFENYQQFVLHIFFDTLVPPTIFSQRISIVAEAEDESCDEKKKKKKMWTQILPV